MLSATPTVTDIANEFLQTYTPERHCKRSFARKGAFPNGSCDVLDPEATQWCALGYTDYLLFKDVDTSNRDAVDARVALANAFHKTLASALPSGLTPAWANDRDNGYDIIMDAVKKVAHGS